MQGVLKSAHDWEYAACYAVLTDRGIFFFCERAADTKLTQAFLYKYIGKLLHD